MKRLFLIPFVFLYLSAEVWAALPVNTTTWEVQHAGSNNNGGCFVAGASGTDHSQQAAAFTAFTDLVVGVTTTQVTSVAHPFGSTDVGNCISIVSGSGCTTGWFSISSVATITATLDRSAGTAASVCTANEGGALATLAQLNTNMGQGHQAFVKADATYSVSSGVSWSFTSNSSATAFPQISGYTTSRGDNGLVTVQASAGSFSVFTIANNNNLYGFTMRNFDVDCNAQTNCVGVTLSDNYEVVQNVRVSNFKNGAFAFNNGFGGGQCTQCYATGGSGSVAAFVFGNSSCFICVAYSNATPGFSMVAGNCTFCIAANNSGATNDGFALSATGQSSVHLLFSVAYKNGRDGVRISPLNPPGIYIIENNISYGNTGKAFNATTAVASGGYPFNWNAYESGALTGLTAGANDVVISADPFVAGGSNNFALNSTAGGGAAVKAKGFPGVLLVGGTGEADIGILQSGTGGSSGNIVSGYSQ